MSNQGAHTAAESTPTIPGEASSTTIATSGSATVAMAVPARDVVVPARNRANGRFRTTSRRLVSTAAPRVTG